MNLVEELGFEANTEFADAPYRKGVFVSILIFLNLLLRSWRCADQSNTEARLTGEGKDLAFAMFKNERDAVVEHIEKAGARWELVWLDLNRLEGLDFRKVFRRSLLKLPGFLFQLARHYGLRSLRTFPHPFFGYLVYLHLRDIFPKTARNRAVVTANISHPVSLGIHYAARSAGLRTVYVEHAMTPRLIAEDRGYDEYLVRSPHTRQLFIGEGIAAERISVLPYWSFAQCAPRLDPARVRTAGIAVNDLDEIESVRNIAAALGGRGIRCLIRVHDADKRLERFRALGRAMNIEISSAARSSIRDFVKSCDLVLAGNSSVLLDCYRAEVPVIYYWTGSPVLFDYYGLVEYTGCLCARGPQDLLKLLFDEETLSESVPSAS